MTDPAAARSPHYRPAIRERNDLELASALPAWTARTAENRDAWRGALTIGDLVRAREAFRDLPCVVCAPGPSLADSLPDLARLRDRVAVVAADSAVAPLLSAGIAPDFVFVKSGDATAASLLAGLPAREAMTFLLPACAHPATLAEATGRKAFYMPTDDHPGLRALARSTGLPTVLLKPSTAVMALLFASALEFDSLVLAGFDFAFTDGKLYCDGTRYLAMPEVMERRRGTADPFERPRETVDLFHEPTLTNRALHESAEDLFRILRFHGPRDVVNASRGILFNVDWLPLPLAVEGVSPAARAFRGAHLSSGCAELDEANEATGNVLNPLIVRNALENRGRAASLRTVADLFDRRDRFRGRTVVVAGAAASLDDALPALRRHRDRFLLLGVDASLAPLLEAGVRPDLVLSVDPMRQVAGFLRGLPTEGIGLVASVATHPEALDAWAGPVYLGWCPTPSTHIMKVYTLFPDMPAFMPHANCGSTATLFALELGAARVLLSGVDFAYTDDRWYARGVRHPNASVASRAELESALGGRAIRTVDARGRDTLTDPTFELYARTLEAHLSRDGFARVRNLGAGICKGIPRIDPDEAFAE